MSEYTDTELGALAAYWQASKHNPIRSGYFCGGAKDVVPLYCRWCNSENVVTNAEIIVCLRCDTGDRSIAV